MTTRPRDYWTKKRVLITGGLGFIGSNLAHRLVALQADVVLLDNLHPECGGNWANVAEIKDCLDYVDDVVEAFLAVAAHEHSDAEIYNLGGSQPASLLAIAQILIELCPQACYKTTPFPPEKKRSTSAIITRTSARLKNKLVGLRAHHCAMA